MIYLSIGSNVGDRLAYLQSAVDQIGQHAQLLGVSSVYETAAWGNTDQASFYNAGVAIHTDKAPRELLTITQSAEQTIGRIRREHWGPREIDIDIILWHENTPYDDDELTLPHRYYQQRAFVVVPTLELASSLEDSATVQLLSPLIETIDDQEIARSEDQLMVQKR